MLSYVGVIERLKVINIAFFFPECIWDEMAWRVAWVCVYKGVKVKTMDENAKSFLCVRERRSFETVNQIKQTVVLKHWIKNVTKSSLETLNQRK